MSTTVSSTDPREQTIGDGRIVVDRLTKRFGTLTAVDDLSFTVDPGRITGFLGPNGAGKTTTLRMLLGLVRQTSGTATIGGRRYADIHRPQRVVGSALEATGFHPGRSGRNHLMVLADTAGVDGSRVDEMLELVGIPAAARRRAGGYSMGMRQRLGLAAAMLGDPQVLLLDEPANGRLVKQGSTADLHGEQTALVRSSDQAALAGALARAGLAATPADGGALHVVTGDLPRIGAVALDARIAVHELRSVGADLEALFFELTEAPGNTNRNLGDPSPGHPGTEREGGVP